MLRQGWAIGLAMTGMGFALEGVEVAKQKVERSISAEQMVVHI